MELLGVARGHPRFRGAHGHQTVHPQYRREADLDVDIRPEDIGDGRCKLRLSDQSNLRRSRIDLLRLSPDKLALLRLVEILARDQPALQRTQWRDTAFQ